ncbi:MAG TPA: flagellar hook-length control protein FliK, partial [Desulfurivibrionaceae bacterium]|nr:flagellar hook-length control protein FliK [Desulfurivibrionaceae bacterium]
AEEGAAGAGSYTLSFFLEMSRLGELQLQVTVQGEEVRGIFHLENDAAVAHLRRELPELKERLAALGYRVGEFSCQPTRTRLLQGLKNALEEAAGLAPTRLLDVKA